MKKIKSFGCSFIHGTDLEIQGVDSINLMLRPSNLTWPALIAEKLGLEYECYALPGQGNFKILCDILANSYKNDSSVFLINWSWIDRFDYVDAQEHWATLRPADENDLQKFYYKNLHSQLCDMVRCAGYIITAADHLKSLNCPYVMTYMDYNLLNSIDPNWHDPRYLEVLQKKLAKILLNFDGVNFLDWSRKNNFAISDSWHPLKDAHRAAAEFWLPTVKKWL